MWKKLLDSVGYFYLFLTILFLVGFYKTTPPVFQSFTMILKIGIALFLILRFFPYQKNKTFSELDRKLILYAAYFILLSTFTDYVNLIMMKFQKIVTETTGDILVRMFHTV